MSKQSARQLLRDFKTSLNDIADLNVLKPLIISTVGTIIAELEGE